MVRERDRDQHAPKTKGVTFQQALNQNSLFNDSTIQWTKPIRKNAHGVAGKLREFSKSPVLFSVDTGPPLIRHPEATNGQIHTRPGPAYGWRPQQQGWLNKGVVAGGQSVAEL
jgi:hypothetical protein